MPADLPLDTARRVVSVVCADLGVTPTMEIVEQLRKAVRVEGSASQERLTQLLRERLRPAAALDPALRAQLERFCAGVNAAAAAAKEVADITAQVAKAEARLEALQRGDIEALMAVAPPPPIRSSTIGDASAARSRSATSSAPKPLVRVASCTTTQRRVLRTEATMVGRSSGHRLRRSMISASMPVSRAAASLTQTMVP